jgi:hypothetical protein
VDGLRRLDSARELGWTHIRAELRRELDPDHRLLIQAAAGAHPVPLSQRDLGQLLQRLAAGGSYPAYADTELAGAIGLPLDVVTHSLRMSSADSSDRDTTTVARSAAERCTHTDGPHIAGACTDCWHAAINECGATVPTIATGGEAA